MNTRSAARHAMTLVELLVVAGIIAMVLALVAVSYPRVAEREQLTRAADKIRMGLLTARLRAKRDNVITGIRFIKAPDDPTLLENNPDPFKVKKSSGFVYVQQPLQPITGVYQVSQGQSLLDPPSRFVNHLIVNPRVSTLVGGGVVTPLEIMKSIKPFDPADLTKGQDYLVLAGDRPHRITRIQIDTPTEMTLELESAVTISLLNPNAFRIIRGVEEIPIQDPESLGDNISLVPLASEGTDDWFPRDILFLPNGQVINASRTTVGLRLVQVRTDLSESDSEIFIDCLTGTTRYKTP